MQLPPHGAEMSVDSSPILVRWRQTHASLLHETLTHNLPKRRQQPVDFLRRVLTHPADAPEAAVLLHIPALAQVQREIISVPGKEPAVSEPGRQLERRAPRDSHRHRRATLPKPSELPDSVKLESANLNKSPHQAPTEVALVGLDRRKSRQQRLSPGSRRRIDPASQFGQVLHARRDSCNAFVIQRTPLPAPWTFIAIRAQPVGLQALQVLPL